jgi:hypothetical protein
VQRRDVVLQNKNRFFTPHQTKQSKQEEEEVGERVNVGTTLSVGQLANIISYFTSLKAASKQDLQRK